MEASLALADATPELPVSDLAADLQGKVRGDASVDGVGLKIAGRVGGQIERHRAIGRGERVPRLGQLAVSRFDASVNGRGINRALCLGDSHAAVDRGSAHLAGVTLDANGAIHIPELQSRLPGNADAVLHLSVTLKEKSCAGQARLDLDLVSLAAHLDLDFLQSSLARGGFFGFNLDAVLVPRLDGDRSIDILQPEAATALEGHRLAETLASRQVKIAHATGERQGPNKQHGQSHRSSDGLHSDASCLLLYECEGRKVPFTMILLRRRLCLKPG